MAPRSVRAIARIGRDYVAGRLSDELVLGLLGPMAILCFAVSVTLALVCFPTAYDFRHRWLSSLASARANPAGYGFLGAGLTVVGVLLLPIPGYLRRRFPSLPTTGRAGWLLLWVGIAGLLCLGVESTFFPSLARKRDAHQLFTLMTLLGLTPGFLLFGALAAFRTRSRRSPVWPAWLGGVLLAAPVLGSGLCQLVVRGIGVEALGWVSVAEAKRQAPFLVSLAFWEWAAVLSLFIGGYLTVWGASIAHKRWAPRVDPLAQQERVVRRLALPPVGSQG